MAEFELKISTSEARNHANEQKNAEETYKNIIENLKAAKSQIQANWEGDATDINDIITRINTITSAFEKAITPSLNKLHTGVTVYAEEVDKIAGNTVNNESGASGAQTNSAGAKTTAPTPEKSTSTQDSGAKTTAPTPEKSTSTQDSGAKTTAPTPEKTTTSGTAPKSATSGKAMDVPSGSTSYKSYTSYKKVASNTPQGAVVYGGKASPYGKYAGTTYNTKTDPETGVRYVTFEGDNTKYYCAAMGTYYGEVGDTFTVKTDKGNTYNVIMCDAKGSDAQGKHNGGTWYHSSGGNKCLTEFYVDTKQMPNSMKVYRNGSYIGTTGTYNSVEQFSGNVTSITKLS